MVAQDGAQGTERQREARAARAAGAFDRAADLFLELHGDEPDEVRWVVEAADALGKADRLDAALQLLERQIERFDGAADLRVLRARTLCLLAERNVAAGSAVVVVQSFYRDAQAVLDDVLASVPDHFEARVLRSNVALQLGDIDRAVSEARSAVEIEPGSPSGHLALGQASFWHFRERLREFHASPPADATQRQDALAAIDRVRDASRNAFRRALAIDPDRAIAQIRLGDIAGWSEEPELAATRYGKALGIDPRLVGQIDMPWLTSAVGPERVAEMWDAARADYTARQDVDPITLALLDYYRGRAHYRVGDFEDAQRSFALVLAAAPEREEFLDTRYWAMRAAYWLGDHELAARHALDFARRSAKKLAGSIKRDQPEAATEIVRFLADRAYEKGRLAASRDLNYVLALIEQTASAWNNYAFLCRETAEYDDAWQGYTNALLIERSPQILNDAAVILQYHLHTPAKLAEARAMYREAIERAEQELADGGLDPEAEKRTRTALRDARNNLRKLN